MRTTREDKAGPRAVNESAASLFPSVWRFGLAFCPRVLAATYSAGIVMVSMATGANVPDSSCIFDRELTTAVEVAARAMCVFICAWRSCGDLPPGGRQNGRNQTEPELKALAVAQRFVLARRTISAT